MSSSDVLDASGSKRWPRPAMFLPRAVSESRSHSRRRTARADRQVRCKLYAVKADNGMRTPLPPGGGRPHRHGAMLAVTDLCMR